MAGIKESKEAVKFVCQLVSETANALDDGKFSLGEGALLLKLAYQLPMAIDGIDKIPSEALDYSPEEIEELKKLVQDELDLPGDKVESLIEGCLDIALQLYAQVKQYQAL